MSKRAEITGYVVKHGYDDGSSKEIKVNACDDDSVWVKGEGSDDFFFDRKSWPVIRDAIDSLFKQMDESGGSRDQ